VGRSRKGTVCWATVLALYLSLTLFPSVASAGKTVETTWGTKSPGSLGRQFDTPGDIAVNEATGQIYVADSRNNRIQRLDADGDFEVAWGWDVVRPGASDEVAGNERQTVSVSAAGGTFKLRIFNQKTAAIPVGASAAQVRSAVEALPEFGPGDVTVEGPAGGPWQIEFAGNWANTDLKEMIAEGDGMTGDPVRLSVTTDTNGAGFERCTDPAECKSGTINGSGGSLNSPEALTIDRATGDVYVVDGHRISVFDADGNFLRLFGWDVVAPGASENVAGNEQQRIAVTGATGESFSLVLVHGIRGETGSIPFDASAAQVQAALEGLPSLVPGDVAVTGPGGGPWLVEFMGTLSDTNVSPLAGKGSDVSPTDPRVQVVTIMDGGRPEVCTVAATCRLATAGMGAGQLFGEDISLAIHPTTGDLFVGGALRVNQFQADGTFVRAFGWGVDTGAEQFEICTELTLCQAAVIPPDIGPAVDAFPGNGQFTYVNWYEAGKVFVDVPNALAVDASGSLYATTRLASPDREGGTLGEPQWGKPFIYRYDSTQSLAGSLLLPDPITDNEPVGRCTYCTPGPLPSYASAADAGLEIDSETGHLLYLSTAGDFSQKDVPSYGVLELDPSTHPATLVDAHLSSAGQLEFNGLGIDSARGKLYVSISHPEVGHRIIVLGENPPPPAVVQNHPATSVGARTATLNGEVTPNGPPGVATRYRFEYSPDDGQSWLRAPSSDGDAGDGTAPVVVSENLTGLEANLLYRARLVATKAFGLGTVVSSEITFKTAALPPEVTTLSVQARTANTALLPAVINANNLPTSYYFEYGTSVDYGSKVPVPDGSVTGGTPRKVLVPITGLTPGTQYHYRIVATNAEGTVVGDDAVFTSRALIQPPDGRGYEMVTPPFKIVRTASGFDSGLRNNPNTGVPSLDGESVLWQVPFFPLSDDVRWPANNDRRILRRTDLGWTNETQNTLAAEGVATFMRMEPLATSGDLETVPLRTALGPERPETGGLLPTDGPVPNRLYTFRKGTGTRGFTPWLTNPQEQVIGVGVAPGRYADIGYQDSALLDDDGTAMVRWGLYAGLADDPTTADDEDPSDDKLSSTQPLGGNMIYSQRATSALDMPAAPKVLVNECTGSGADATQIPVHVSGGLIEPRPCKAGTLTHKRGAVVGGGSQPRAGTNPRMQGGATTALSDDGNRIFFQSPDPYTSLSACAPGINSQTDCPPQLFVRQFTSDGTPTVRWISHSRALAGEGNGFTGTASPNQLIPAQSVGQMGAGTAFQGASRDGRYVYFQTNAPLVPTDPNGGASITAGQASESSWDLYRYELPQSLDADPDAGTLLRVSGGPSGAADPNTNPHSGAGGNGASLRFLSDDGMRAYFVTAAPIAGADNAPPAGGNTNPATATSAAVGTTRNLYMFDATKPLASQYRFIATVPFATSGMSSCASWGKEIGFAFSASAGRFSLLAVPGTNCFRGTPDGKHVVFFTDGRLSGDDTDTYGDVYLYDAEADELVRVSAPPVSAEPYPCHTFDIREPIPPDGGCNADLGVAPSSGLSGPAYGTGPTTRGFGGLRYYNVSRNPDGTASVFFESRSQLVSEDTNGDYYDTYEWREGELSLISPGNTQDDSWFSGNSVDGQDVFIWTSARIDPRELDDSDFDLYDARRGSRGFPLQEDPRPCDVLALECDQGVSAPVPPQAPPSLRSGPDGNLKADRPPRCRKGTARRKGRCVRVSKRCAKVQRKRCAPRRGKGARHRARARTGGRG
jgi:hypothetical protein